MLDLGLLGFTQPWLLAALVAVPAIWWLLRIIPPAPQLVRFPAVRFLLGIEQNEETSARTPLWLLLLRLALAILLIVALAGPVWNPEPEMEGDGPLVLVVDDGWAAAPRWQARQDALERYLTLALRQNREVIMIGTAPDPALPRFQRVGAAEALNGLAAWQPKAWPGNRRQVIDRLAQENLENVEVLWLSDGVAESDDARADARRLAAALRNLGSLTILLDERGQRAKLLLPPDATETDLTVRATRPASEGRVVVGVQALGPGGEVLVREPLAFEPGAREAEAVLTLPLEMRNRIARFELSPPEGVGGVVLLDERWRRRAVGLVGLGTDQVAQPLLSEIYYIDRALRVHADIQEGDIASLVEADLSAIVLTDGAQLSPDDRGLLRDWIDQGGVLLRFAGPRLANADQDDLTPVPLRQGDRFLDGTLSWARPLPLASFDDRGPLATLDVPEDDVVIRRQVLAQPGPALVSHSWARLSDGTPLITGTRQGDGWIVLVHTTANTSWSSLPLSVVFVDILRQIVGLGAGTGGAPEGLLAPIEVLDAFGHLVEPAQSAQPVEGEEITTISASASHPPGLYGRLGADKETARQALNLASAVPELQPLTPGDLGGEIRGYDRAKEVSLMPWLLFIALTLALIDGLISLWLRGLLAAPRPGRATAGILVFAAVLSAGREAPAQSDQQIIEATNETHLAYVMTGLAEVDNVSRAGLEGLSLVLNRRTAVEVGDPLAVDLEVDDLNLYPLLYWPIPENHPDISREVRRRIDIYLRQGGMILFDTVDAGSMIPGQADSSPGERRLRQLLAGVNLPPLEPIPEEHTLTRSFYLLQEFPGRWTGRTVWVDQPEPSVNDGVSSVIIGGHDWAGAWAIDEFATALFPVMPGGERQREMAMRFGVNLVMYALTGNYKTDQVHIPALLERLGQ